MVVLQQNANRHNPAGSGAALAGAGIAAAGAYLDARFHITKDVAGMWRARKYMNQAASNGIHVSRLRTELGLLIVSSQKRSYISMVLF